MNFILRQMSHIRYMIPLIIEGNYRGIKSTIYWQSCGKYNSPHLYGDVLKNFSKKFCFTLINSDSGNLNGITFNVEGDGIENFQTEKLVILTNMTDFHLSHKRYWDKIDNCIFPSKYFASLAGRELDSKSLFLGSPKYDVTLDKKDIYKKYNLNEDYKYAFMPLPRARDYHNMNINNLCSLIKDMGYKVITKTRGKDNCSAKSDLHLVDFSWYPHDSMELMSVSDFVINFDSTSIKECIKLKKKVLNYNIKPFQQLLPVLYESKSVLNIKKDFDLNNELRIKKLLESPCDFDYYIDQYLFTGNSSKRIIDYFFK